MSDKLARAQRTRVARPALKGSPPKRLSAPQRTHVRIPTGSASESQMGGRHAPEARPHAQNAPAARGYGRLSRSLTRSDDERSASCAQPLPGKPRSAHRRPATGLRPHHAASGDAPCPRPRLIARERTPLWWCPGCRAPSGGVSEIDLGLPSSNQRESRSRMTTSHQQNTNGRHTAPLSDSSAALYQQHVRDSNLTHLGFARTWSWRSRWDRRFTIAQPGWRTGAYEHTVRDGGGRHPHERRFCPMYLSIENWGGRPGNQYASKPAPLVVLFLSIISAGHRVSVGGYHIASARSKPRWRTVGDFFFQVLPFRCVPMGGVRYRHVAASANRLYLVTVHRARGEQRHRRRHVHPACAVFGAQNRRWRCISSSPSATTPLGVFVAAAINCCQRSREEQHHRFVIPLISETRAYARRWGWASHAIRHAVLLSWFRLNGGGLRVPPTTASTILLYAPMVPRSPRFSRCPSATRHVHRTLPTYTQAEKKTGMKN